LLKEFGPFDESLIRLYIIQVLHAFAYLHDLNIAHRDLKCGNLLLSEEGIIKLADFGTAKKADETPQYPHDHDSIVDAAR
jgi:serine/threonine protein kinase